MSNYVLVFRGQSDRVADPQEEAAWGQWFGEISPNIVDFGNRVGRATALGQDRPGSVVTGYTLVQAENYEAAIALAEGCPGLAHGGGVEVGETVPNPSS